ncbi:MAG: hypothetical protein NTV22_08375 [bacterium]|nr:hypothetical protein [bacterium]
MSKHASHILVGVAGEYFVCAELCRLGYLALMTPKNNPLFDVVATTADGNCSVSIQVKTKSAHNTQGWKLSTDITKGNAKSGLFVILVDLSVSVGAMPDLYIYEYAVLSNRVSELYHQYMSKLKTDGSRRKEVGFRWFDKKYFIEDDLARKNNWKPIVNTLSLPCAKHENVANTTRHGLFTIRPDCWYAAEIIEDRDGSYGEDRSYSPILVTSIVPARNGQRRFELAFYHANYPQGVQDKVYLLRTLVRSDHFILARSVRHTPVRDLLIYDITWQWLHAHFGVQQPADCDDITDWLAENAHRFSA